MNSCPENNIKKLEVKSIGKNFGDVHVLKDISMNVKSGEFVTMLGLSGSGKSTVMNIISGLSTPDSGKVYINGEDVTGRTGKVGYMQQKDLLLPWSRVMDNLILPLVLTGTDKTAARKRAAEFLPVFGLSGYENKYPAELSGGMRQRAALLRTYLFFGEIILLDEPFGALDAITRSRMQLWLCEVMNELKASVLLITHDIDEAILLSDRIYILTDKPAEILHEEIVDLMRPRSHSVLSEHGFAELREKLYGYLESSMK